MNYKVKHQIADLVYEFASVINNKNMSKIENVIDDLTSMG